MTFRVLKCPFYQTSHFFLFFLLWFSISCFSALIACNEVVFSVLHFDEIVVDVELIQPERECFIRKNVLHLNG